ncbi:MAG: nitrite reductase small subunit NirD [Nitrospiraceae bacterium]|jgi:NAD(P)H-dependent nitrite reductase small subunit|nr:nitrite reductase small subunit NirD [Nitrospiraceae bacterium]
MKSVTVTYSAKENEGQLVMADGQEIALFRVNGDFHAIENRCPHRGGYLSDGTVRGERVSCPLHGWTFDLKTGECTTRPGEKIACFEVRNSGEEVTVLFP